MGASVSTTARSTGKRASLFARACRVLSYVLIAAGALTLIWVVVVWRWQDPFTALYTKVEQHRLAASFDRTLRTYRPPRAASGTSGPALREAIARDAAAYAGTLRLGSAVGRLTIGRIGLNMIVVQGTDESSLERGPGHYATSGLPGQGSLIYVAGHRTTYLAPFAEINDIRNGDYVTFQVPYGTFTYRVFRHYIVKATDLAVLQNHGQEILRLQACHPRFFATHRYIVDARLVAYRAGGSRTSVSAAPAPQG